jgi:hypothetical protein
VFGLSPGDAVGTPRIHVWGSKTLAEPSFPVDVLAELGQRGEQLATAEAINAVQMVAVERVGGALRLVATGDPRKGGVALAE